MKLVFIDETSGKRYGEEFVAATAAVFESSLISEYRKELVSGISNIIFGFDRSFSEIQRIPTLHASDLPRNIDDEMKIVLFRFVIKTCVKYNVKFFRVGYIRDKSIPFLKTTEDYIEFCLINCVYPIQSYFNHDIAYIYELSYSSHRKFKSYNDSYMHDYAWQSKGVSESISIPNFGRTLGKLYCDKHNHCMYASDFMGYALMLRDKYPRSEFHESIMLSADIAKNNILYDAIIRMKFSG